MGKELSEMTLEELWELFPIFLVPPDPRWNDYYRETETEIADLLTGDSVKKQSHRKYSDPWHMGQEHCRRAG